MTATPIRTLYRSPEDFLDREVLVEGWVRTNRQSGKIGFIELNDGSFFRPLQIVYSPEEIENFEEVSRYPIASALRVKGQLVATPGARQPFEVRAASISLEAPSHSDYPLQKKRHSLEFLREQAHLRPRTNTFGAVFRVRSIAAYAVHKFFQERHFIYAHPPIITGSDAEGAGDMFQVTTLDLEEVPKTPEGQVDYSKDFFGKATNLTVSGQLEAEVFALAFKNTYTFGPTFRSENSNTARHASEFWMIEPEIAFADLDDNLRLIEDMVKFIISYTLEQAPEEMAFFDQFIQKGLLDRLRHIVASDFERITYTEAIDLLQASGKTFQYPVDRWGIDLQSEHERYITEEVFKKPVFVVDYPKEIKAFYMRLNEDGKTVAACDLLVPGVGEIVGGSQREERHDVLLEKIRANELNEEDYWWYLELRKYGGVKHAGFGLGFERMIMYMTGMSNIRDVIPFPRTPRNADF